MRWCLSFIIVSLLLFAGAETPGASVSDLPIVGSAEEAVLLPWGLPLWARMDTGAAVSSLDARSVRLRTVKNQRVVRFTLAGDNGLRVAVELPLAGVRRVSSADGGVENRPVVELETCLAGQRIRAEFTLNNRSRMEYRMIIGRNILAGRFLVDAGAKDITIPRCPATH